MDILDVNFLNTTYMGFIKELSFWVCIIGVLCCGLAILAYFFKQEIIKDILTMLCIIIAIILVLITFVDFMMIGLIPALYLSSFIKFTMNLYLVSYDNIINNALLQVIINFISLVISLSLYGVIINRALQNSTSNIEQTNE